ncbi:hypothetical protein [Notoacmeibacter marinus]|uniref:hypothetical protein n=1 Tax=Notoacmeibacter marinus TaxID=1876515 RepID=UPI000DF3123C|nr:hypothetical protein [Notoacmeibacter marinus]
MTGAQTGTEENKDSALDPATERLRGKLLRFMIINLLVIFGLLIVVIGILVYRNAEPQDEEADRSASATLRDGSAATSLIGGTLRLKPGEAIADMVAEGRRVTLHIKGEASERLVQIDIRDGSVIGDIAIETTR